MATSQALAERNVADEQGEAGYTESKHEQVEHRSFLRANCCAGAPIEKAEHA
jgi:hypothetical protein